MGERISRNCRVRMRVQGRIGILYLEHIFFFLPYTSSVGLHFLPEFSPFFSSIRVARQSRSVLPQRVAANSMHEAADKASRTTNHLLPCCRQPPRCLADCNLCIPLHHIHLKCVAEDCRFPPGLRSLARVVRNFLTVKHVYLYSGR